TKPDESGGRGGSGKEERGGAGLGKENKKRRWVREKEVPADLTRFVWRHLGQGWSDFVESFGIPYPGTKRRKDWTRANLLKEIRRWRRAGHRLNYRAVADSYQALIHQARKFFGSWDKARAAAGV